MNDTTKPDWLDAYDRQVAEESARVNRARLTDLRDQFAMAALTGLLMNPKHNTTSYESIAIRAYIAADSMLEARMPG